MLTLGGDKGAGAADEEQQAKLLRQLEKEGALELARGVGMGLFPRRCFRRLGQLQAGWRDGSRSCDLCCSAGPTKAAPKPPLPSPRPCAAGVMSTLHHPNVCHLLAITRQPACLVMEYASRRSIDKLLAAGLRDAKVGGRRGARGAAGVQGRRCCRVGGQSAHCGAGRKGTRWLQA